MTTFIRVKRPENYKGTMFLEDRYEIRLFNGVPHDVDEPFNMADVHFFEVDPRFVDRVVQHIAATCPGVDIEVYRLDWIGFCPAGNFVKKTVTEDGVLPE